MDYGFSIPHRGPLANPEAIERLAKAGEDLGFGYLTVSDHIVVPKDIASRYPYSETGEFPGSSSGESMEQLALLAYLAGITRRPRLLTSVMVLPHRPPVFTAKAIATIDLLSGGRVSVGCGVGWLREEFEAIGAPPFDERGKASDEYIRVFKELWTNPDPSFSGDYANFSNITFLPRPVQNPHPPIWIGGESGPAFRRVVALGDCWYPIGANPQHPLDSVELYTAALNKLRAEAERAGRDPSTIDLAYNAPWHDETEQGDGRGNRRIFTGDPGQRAADIARFAELGVRHLFINLAASTVDRAIARMEKFMSEVAPKVG